MNRIPGLLYGMALLVALLVAVVVLWGCHPLPPPRPVPTPRPTATHTPIPAPKPEARQLTSGRAVFELDLSGFSVPPVNPDGTQLDTFAFATLAWIPPSGSGPDRFPITPALQLGLRGTDAHPCLAKPCQGQVALEVRYSSNIAFDRTQTDEHLMCGAGTRPPQWIPLGWETRPRVVLEWGPGFVRASTSAGTWTTSQGAAGPGFGWWIEGIPTGGIGWAYKWDWTLQAHGGAVRLVSWEAVGVQGGIVGCP